MKTCRKCKIEKDLSEFGKLSKAEDGLNSTCILCMREYHKNLYHSSEKRRLDIRQNDQRNRDRIYQLREEYLEDKSCTDCGNKDRRLFHFDHITDNKEFNIADAISRSYSWERILKEINKCEVVCSNCHTIRTWERRQRVVAKSG